MSGRERFLHPYKKCFVLFLTRCGISQSTPFEVQRSCWHSFSPPINVGLSIHPLSRPNVLASTSPHVHPLQGSASSLVHRSVFDFDTIYNDPSPPLTDIVPSFGLPYKVFKTRLLGRERFPHPYKECFVLLLDRSGIS